MKGLLFALVLSVCVAELLAVTCYSCSYLEGFSASGMECLDPFNATSSQSTTECEGECTKSITTVNGEVTLLSRGCSPQCPSSGCTSLLGIEACNYCCSGDKCNGATSVTFGLVTMGLSVLIGGMTAAW